MASSSDRFSSGDAGRGAHEQARRAAARAQRLRAQLESAERRQRAWSAGEEGEHLVAHALRSACWPSLHDQPWPGRQRANLDHLAISSSRIWLIDAKHWSGEVVVRQGVLRQNGYRRDDNLSKAMAAAQDVGSALGPGAPPVAPVVCLTQAGRDLMPTLVSGVVVVGLDHLGTTLGRAPQNYEKMAELVSRVRQALETGRGAAAPRTTTVEHSPVVAPIPTYVPPAPHHWAQVDDRQPFVAPFPTRPHARYADWAERVVATFIDGALLAVPVLVGSILTPVSESLSLLVGWVWLALVGYVAWLNGAKGQSPGKALMGLKLVRDVDGSPLGGPVGIVRGLVLAVLGFLSVGLFWLLAVLWPLWSRRKQALHDKIVSATVMAGLPRARFGKSIFMP